MDRLVLRFRGKRLAKRFAARLAADPVHMAHLNSLVEEYRDGRAGPGLTLNEIRVEYSLSDPPMLPRMNLFKEWR